MYDANLVDFYSRVARYQDLHAKGHCHESWDKWPIPTRGRKRKPAALRRGLMPVVWTAAVAFGLKATILHSVGAAQYQLHLEALTVGPGLNAFGGWLMQIDPITAALADTIASLASMIAR